MPYGSLGQNELIEVIYRQAQFANQCEICGVYYMSSKSDLCSALVHVKLYARCIILVYWSVSWHVISWAMADQVLLCHIASLPKMND